MGFRIPLIYTFFPGILLLIYVGFKYEHDHYSGKTEKKVMTEKKRGQPGQLVSAGYRLMGTHLTQHLFCFVDVEVSSCKKWKKTLMSFSFDERVGQLNADDKLELL